MNSRSKVAWQLLLSLITPVIGLIYAFKSRSHSFIVFSGTLFMGLVGSTFIYRPGSDGYTHLEVVKNHYLDMSFFQFISDSTSLLMLQPVEGSKDLYKHILSYVSGSILGTPEMLHFFAGLVLGYFFTKSVLLVLETKPKHKVSILLLSFIALFLIIRSISALNSIRMWTAMWVFFYGAYAYVKRGKTKYLWVVLLAALIHFSYLLYAVPLAAALVLKRRKLLIAILFVSSFFGTINYNTATKFIQSAGVYESNIGVNIIDQEERQRRAAQAKASNKSSNFYKEYGPYVYGNYSIVFLSFILLFLYLRQINNAQLEFLIAGGLLILALANMSGAVSPSVSGRGITIAATFLTAAAIQVISLMNSSQFSTNTKNLINFSFYAFFISSMPHLLFHISYAINSISAFIVILPIISWILGYSDFSIREAIGDII